MSYASEEASMNMAEMPAMPGNTAPSAIGQAMPFRIARSGARPLKFAGSELAMAMSFTPELPYWYEINLYRTNASQFVLAIRLFHQSEEKRDTVEAWQFKSLDEALAAIEHYDAAADVEAVLPDTTGQHCAAEIAAQAFELRARIETQREHYRGLAGEILHELDAG